MLSTTSTSQGPASCPGVAHLVEGVEGLLGSHQRRLRLGQVGLARSLLLGHHLGRRGDGTRGWDGVSGRS